MSWQGMEGIMRSKKCSACGRKFMHQSPGHQTHCSTSKCQRERRRQWQRERRKSDPDYKDNQSRAQRAWAERNPSYWRDYRRRNPDYTEKNRVREKERRLNRKAKPVAKMDLQQGASPALSGTYMLVPISADGVAKMDSWTVEIRFISRSSIKKDKD